MAPFEKDWLGLWVADIINLREARTLGEGAPARQARDRRACLDPHQNAPTGLNAGGFRAPDPSPLELGLEVDQQPGRLKQPHERADAFRHRGLGTRKRSRQGAKAMK